MNRRTFFGTMIGGVAAAAVVRTWPFRVYSFPSEVRFSTYGIAYAQVPQPWILHPEQFAVIKQMFPEMIEQQRRFLQLMESTSPVVTWNNLLRSPLKWKPNAGQAEAIVKKYAQGIDVQAALDAL